MSDTAVSQFIERRRYWLKFAGSPIFHAWLSVLCMTRPRVDWPLQTTAPLRLCSGVSFGLIFPSTLRNYVRWVITARLQEEIRERLCQFPVQVNQRVANAERYAESFSVPRPDRGPVLGTERLLPVANAWRNRSSTGRAKPATDADGAVAVLMQLTAWLCNRTPMRRSLA